MPRRFRKAQAIISPRFLGLEILARNGRLSSLPFEKTPFCKKEKIIKERQEEEEGLLKEHINVDEVVISYEVDGTSQRNFTL